MVRSKQRDSTINILHLGHFSKIDQTKPTAHVKRVISSVISHIATVLYQGSTDLSRYLETIELHILFNGKNMAYYKLSPLLSWGEQTNGISTNCIAASCTCTE